MNIHKFYKKVINSILIGSIAISMIGCGKNTIGTSGNTTDGDSYVYVPEYISLTDKENTYVGDMFKLGNKLYYMQSESDEENQESKDSICFIDLDNVVAGPQVYRELTSQDNEEGFSSYTVKRMMTDDGSIIQIDQTYQVAEDGYSEQDGSLYLRKTDADNKEIFCNDITSFIKIDPENSYVQHAVESSNGNLILSNGCSYIWIFDQDGNHQMDIKLDSTSKYGGYINSFGNIGDGRAAYIENGNNGMILHVYDENKKDFSEIYENLPSDCWNTGITPGTDNSVLLCGQNCLYEYDLTTKESKEITKWLDVDLSGDFVSRVYALENGDLAIHYNDWNTEENSVIILKKTLASEVKQKEVITLGCMNLSQNMQAAVVNFNKNNEQYKISVKDYSSTIDWTKDSASDDYETAMNQFQADIATGNGPDLFVASDVDIDMLAVKGIIEDLNTYLKKSQVIKRSDLIEPVLNAYTSNGILCTIPGTFSVYTLTGRTSEVGEKSGWSLDEMIDFANQYPDSELICNTSNISMLDYCVMFDFDSYVDWKTGECRFDTDEFRKVLEFAKQYPDEESISYDISEPKLLRTHKALLAITSLTEPVDWQVAEKMFDEPVTAIGFPSKDSTGVVVNGNDGVCINTSSKNKDAAWSFIESLFVDDNTNSNYGWGFSTKKSLYDAKMEKAMVAEYVKDENGDLILDENGNPQECSNGGYSWGDDIVIDVYSVKQEEADAIWQIINQIDGTMKYNMQLMNMIEEEAAPFFKGQKTVDEVMDIIQSRVQVYVNESR